MPTTTAGLDTGDVQHIAGVMERVISEAERRWHLDNAWGAWLKRIATGESSDLVAVSRTLRVKASAVPRSVPAPEINQTPPVDWEGTLAGVAPHHRPVVEPTPAEPSADTETGPTPSQPEPSAGAETGPTTPQPAPSDSRCCHPDFGRARL